VSDNYLSESEQRDRRPERSRVMSSSTRLVGALMLLALLGGTALDYLSSIGVIGGREFILAGLTLVPLPVAALMLFVAGSFAKGAIRTQWMIFGAGMLSVGVGNIIFMGLYITTGKDPYPSIADVFTLVGYAFFAVGLLFAIRAYRELLSIREPLLIAAGVATVAMAFVYFTVIGPYVVFATGDSQPLVTRVFNTLYPVLDVFVLLMPTVALGLIVSNLGAGRVAWPWWCVIAGAGILSVTDTVFAYAGYVGAGRTPLIDFGYALAPLLIGFAVMVARDVYRS
jgi:hypothetical protein